YEFVGALVGYADNSMIEGISIKDNFFVKVEEDYCGGLVGRAKDSTIKNISGDASITISSWRYSGVIVGSSKDSDISDVHIRGTIIANSDYDTAGGLIGVISNTAEHSVKNCSVVSEETGYVKSPSNVGGLIGNCSGETNISQCYAKIPVKGTNYLGGLVGSFTSGNIINCHSNCDLTAEGSVNFVGGLVGKCSGNVATSYAEGNIRLNCTNASYIGTMIGFLGSSSSVEKSFTAVNISVADGYTPTLQRHYVPSNSNIPLWWLEDDDYIYNTSGTNYVSEGYKESLNWDSDVWDNLTEGALPTLKN
ncbi:MAG: hypothetical protein II567_01570, partial [Candidatus Riflebacteria bacterium]|nr:hypothetical protein [Candidatus Riflebacteria bacterium]